MVIGAKASFVSVGPQGPHILKSPSSSSLPDDPIGPTVRTDDDFAAHKSYLLPAREILAITPNLRRGPV
ncbi:hypothetical protein CHU98_g7698 [Xylaria longipes]|nr:hypothetical protein CHU98_g7698 [Xylaria longipes]